MDEGERALELLAKLGRGELSAGQVLGLEPAVLDRLVERAKALFAAGRPAEGDVLLARLAEMETRSAALPFLLGGLRAAHGDLNGAVSAYTEALSRAGDREALAAKIAYGRGQALLLLEAVGPALADLARAAAGEGEVARAAAALLARVRATQSGEGSP